MLGPSSHHQRATLTATILGMQLAAVTTIGIATSTDAHADSDLGPPRAADTTPFDGRGAGVGIALHAGGEFAGTHAPPTGSHALRNSQRLDHRRGDDRDRPDRGRDRGRELGRGRSRDSCRDDELSGVAAIGAGAAICAFGLLVPLGEPEHPQSPEWDGDGWSDDRWDDDQSDAWRDGSYNAANVLLVAVGGGLIAWGVHIETQSRHRSFALAPSFKPDGTAGGIETGLVATVTF
ncbi:MAG: hypothetical protein IT349_16980 [Candidatus Eisenbacteria bacterium]|nr:hypothetical protein [Candidatus Eisenbacteria bacterium]